jgi:hypothetical protein
MNRRFFNRNRAICVSNRRLGGFGGRAFVLFFLLTRLPGQLFLPPDLMIICFCHAPMYALESWKVRVFARRGGDLTRPGMPRSQIRRL